MHTPPVGQLLCGSIVPEKKSLELYPAGRMQREMQ
jgi:hypothetical protein